MMKRIAGKIWGGAKVAQYTDSEHRTVKKNLVQGAIDAMVEADSWILVSAKSIEETETGVEIVTYSIGECVGSARAMDAFLGAVIAVGEEARKQVGGETDKLLEGVGSGDLPLQ